MNIHAEYSKYHPSIPSPCVGFEENWALRHQEIRHLKGDHRACPAIQQRQTFGLTLFMPYTVVFHRSGQVNISSLWDFPANKVFEFYPQQKSVDIHWRNSKKPVSMPACLMPLPRPLSRTASIGLFVLGDLRVNAWIIESGIYLRDVPFDLDVLILPLPNHHYSHGYSVGQAQTIWKPRMKGHLKIPIDLDFSGRETIEIPKGTPMMQYVFARLTRLELREGRKYLAAGRSRKNNLAQKYILSPEWKSKVRRLQPIQRHGDGSNRAAYLEMQLDHCLMKYRLDDPELDQLRLLATRKIGKQYHFHRDWAVCLSSLGVISTLAKKKPARHVGDAISKWVEIYETGKFYAWHQEHASSELQKSAKDVMRELPNSEAIDLGCGTGTDALFLAECGFRVTGIDLAPIAISIAERRRKRDGKGKMTFVSGDVFKFLPSCRERFAFMNDRFLYCYLSNVKERMRYIRLIHQACFSGGTVLLHLPHPSERNDLPVNITAKTVHEEFSKLFKIRILEPHSRENQLSTIFFHMKK